MYCVDLQMLHIYVVLRLSVCVNLRINVFKIKMKKKKKTKIAIYQSKREIHTVAAREAPGDLGLKSHPKDYQQRLTYHYGHPSKYKPRSMMLNLSVGRDGMPIATE